MKKMDKHRKNKLGEPSVPFLCSYNQKKLKTAFFIDGFLNIFCGKKEKSKKYEGSPKKILVIQSHLVGDVMMAVPFLKALKAKYPDAKIFLCANDFAKDLLEGQPFVDCLWTVSFPWGVRSYSLSNVVRLVKMILKLRKEKFDLAIDAQIDFRNIFFMFLTGAKNRLGYDIVGGRLFLTHIPDFPKNVRHLLEARLSVLSACGIENPEKQYHLEPSQEAEEWVRDFFKERPWMSAQDIVAIHPGASTIEKLWPSERFAKVIEFLSEHKYPVVLIQGPQDEKTVQEINDCLKVKVPIVKATLGHLLSFFNQCRLVICLDSAASHLAYAAGAPAVVLYGPQWPFSAKPLDDRIVAVWIQDLDCRPCIYNSCKSNVCMSKITVESVLDAVQKLLKVKKEEGVSSVSLRLGAS